MIRRTLTTLGAVALLVCTGLAAPAPPDAPPPNRIAGTGVLELDQAGAFMGNSVAGAGDVNGDGYADVIVAAPGYDLGTQQGAALIFHGGPNGVADGPPATIDGIIQSDTATTLDLVVASAGDVNADGYGDIIVGDSGYALGEANEGVAFVFHGGPAGIGHRLTPDADAIIQSNQIGALLGASVACAGDVNDDGYDDVVVGATRYDSTIVDTGAVLVFHGGPSGVGDGTPATADALIQTNQRATDFGVSVAGAGDTNGDGYDDIVAGAYVYDSGQSNEGLAFVYHGGPAGVGSGLAALADAVLQSNQSGAQFGRSVDGAGDVNADGFDDVIVGAPFYLWSTGIGAAFIYYGGSGGVGSGGAANADAVVQSELNLVNVGSCVAGVGDTNGDNHDDVAVSSPSSPNNADILVFHGRVGGIGTRGITSADLVIVSDQEDNALGISLAGAGDTNRDRLDDIVAGDNIYSSGQASEGAAYVFRGQNRGDDTIGAYVPSSGAWFLRNANSAGAADLVFTFGAAGAGFVVITGDWDGDGMDTPGIYAPSTGAFFLRNGASSGPADLVFTFGAPASGFVPIAGDWDADGVDTIGLFAPATSTFFLRNENASGAADLAFAFGPSAAGWTPVAGDWDGLGSDSVGLYDPVTSSFFLRNANAPGPADVTFGYGPAGAGWRPVVGDFDADGDTTVGLYNPATAFFFLRNTNTAGAAELTFGYGPTNVVPLVGDWAQEEVVP